MTEYPSVVRPGRVSGPPRHRRGRRPGRRAAAVRDGERGPAPARNCRPGPPGV